MKIKLLVDLISDITFMVNFTTPSLLTSFLENLFHFKHHLQDFLYLDPETIETKLAAEQEEIKNLGHKDFNR
ncbi:MAG: hypothetical protein V7K37_10325 [Nostoc sp.]